MEAAFFDLDKTVISKPSMVAYGPSLYRAGLISRRLIAQSVWADLVFRVRGADEVRMTAYQQRGLRIITGWEAALVSSIVEDQLDEVIEPLVYDEARTLIDDHRRAGRRTYLVSSAPEEIVVPVGQRLGIDEVIASRAGVDGEGRYTGEAEFWSFGRAKAARIHTTASHHGISLPDSFAYSDSSTDVPMLETVGHPVAVNADRALTRVAVERGWETRRFTRRTTARSRVRSRVG